MLESRKRSAVATYDGRTGYQPVLALCAEQDVVLADECRDGNVPAGSGNQRVVGQALATLAGRRRRGVAARRQRALRADTAALAGGAGSATRSAPPWAVSWRRRSGRGPDGAWQPESEDATAVRPWAEVPYVPSDGVSATDRPVSPRYLALRVSRKQDERFADGSTVKHFAIVTNRPDPDGGSGLDLIRWQRGKAGTVKHAYHVLTNELAAAALPSQGFGANAAWFGLNVLLYNPLSAFKRIALLPDLHAARPKRLRFVLLNGIGRVVRHARETVLRLVGTARRRLADAARLALATGPPIVCAEDLGVSRPRSPSCAPAPPWAIRQARRSATTTEVVAGSQARTSYNNPNGNADAERFLRTLKKELVWLRAWTSPAAFFEALDRWLADDNATYLHSALGYRTPNVVEAEPLGHATPLATAC